MRLVVLVLAPFVAVALSGCVYPFSADAIVEGEPSGQAREADEFWLVIVSGSETQFPVSTRMCSVLWTNTVDEAAQTIRYSSDPLADNRVGPSPKVLISAVVWDASSCPIVNRITDEGIVDVPMRALGTVVITATPDGRVMVGDAVLEPGQSITLSDRARGPDEEGRMVRFTDELVVRAVGPWPYDSLMAES